MLHDPVWRAEYLRRKAEGEYLIDGVIHRRLSVISGAVGTGKTYLAAGMAAAMLNGEAYFAGQPIRREINSVLWVHTDLDGEAEAYERIEPLLTEHGRQKPLLAMEYDPDTDFLEYAVRFGVDLVVIDNLLGMADFKGLDLGRSTDAAKIMRPVEELSSVVPVLLLHHTAKPGAEGQGGLIGGQGHYGNTRITIKARTKGTLTLRRSDGVRTLTIDNNRHAPVSLRLRLVIDDRVWRWEKVDESEKPRRERDPETVDERAALADRIVTEQPSAASFNALAGYVRDQRWTDLSRQQLRTNVLPNYLRRDGDRWVRVEKV